MTATLEQPRTIPRIPTGRESGERVTPSGPAAALVVCGWMFAADRWTDPYYVWTSLAVALALALLLRPIRLHGLLGRAWLAPVQLAATVMVLFTGDRALATWEEHVPRFAAASTFASVVLNLIGYRTAAERGLLLIDHPEGVVTILPSMEKLALRAFLLFWLAWFVLQLVRGYRQMIVRSIVGLAATLLGAISSFFGRRGPHPEMEHGRTALAATVRVGRGRIAAFTDSTVWSSFAVFSHDREKLAMDLVRMLNREQSPYEQPIRCATVAVALIGALMGLWMVRSGMALPAILFGLAGFRAGAAAAELLHRSLYAWPEPSAPISEVTFLWQGGACAYPPVLGTPGSLPADRCFDTLLVSVQRFGLVPRVAYTYDGDDFLKPETRAMFVVAPVNVPPARTMARLRDFVRKGGSLIVLDDSRIGERGSAKEFRGLFDASIT